MHLLISTKMIICDIVEIYKNLEKQLFCVMWIITNVTISVLPVVCDRKAAAHILKLFLSECSGSINMVTENTALLIYLEWGLFSVIISLQKQRQKTLSMWLSWCRIQYVTKLVTSTHLVF